MFTIVKPPAPDQLPPLSPEDAAKPYAKYYYMGSAQPAEDVMKDIVWGEPMDVQDALSPEDVNKMLDSGYMKRENGYCVLPNGIGYSAAYTKILAPSEANAWWIHWHERDDLRYKLWCPGSHEAVGPGWSREDIGLGVEMMVFVSVLPPQMLGFDMEKLANTSDFNSVVGFNVYAVPVGADSNVKPLPIVVMHYTRKIEGGIEMRSRFWTGMHFRNGKPIVLLNEGERIPDERAFALANHAAHEMATLARLLPELYPECRDIP